MNFHRFFRPLFLPTAAALLATGGFVRAQEPAPDQPFEGKTIDTLTANDILKLVRYSYTLYDHDFTGQLRTDDRQKIPFRLSLQPNAIRFRFFDPDQIIHLSTGSDELILREVVKGSDEAIAPSRYGEAIRGTDVTYEDLSMRFLYWKNAKIVNEEKLRPSLGMKMETWQVRVVNPDGKGNYATVDMWVDKGSGALAKMMGYNRQGLPVKRFEVLHGKKMDDVWMVDEMRIDTIDPETTRTISHTYLEIDEQVEGVRPES